MSEVRSSEVLIESADGLTRALFLTTALTSRGLRLRVGDAVVGAAVSVNGAPPRTDPDLWRLEGEQLLVPDPGARPEGLALGVGDNVVQVWGVLATGEMGPPAQATLRRVAEDGLGGVLRPPSGLYVVRRSTSVEVVAEAPDEPDMRGVRFWVSRGPGGAGSGWRLLSPATVVPKLEQGEDVPAGSATSSVGDQVGWVRLLAAVDPDQGPPGEASEIGRVRVSGGADYRVVADVVGRRTSPVARFTHDRTEGGSIEAALGPLLPDDPLYYAATALYDDAGIERESPLSPEVVGAPLAPGPAGGGSLAEPSRDQVRAEAAAAVLQRRRDLDVKPGSFWSDVFLDPLSVEADRIRFILDFVHRARSPRTLLEVDDPGLLGESIPVSQSPYKQALRVALHLRADADVQRVIDRAFEALASNVGVQRGAGRRSIGLATVYTTALPVDAVDVGVGARLTIGGQGYHALEAGSIPPGGTGSSYDPLRGRWAVQVQVEADNPGTSGNLAAGQQGTLFGYPSSVRVTNETDLLGGEGAWSNLKLTEETERALASVDSGTERGLERTAVRVPGVAEVRTVAAGNPLLRRGPGTADIWIRGSMPATLEEVAVFLSASKLGGEAVLVGDPRDLRFQIVDPELSEKTPLLALIDIPDRGFGLENQTRGYRFNLRDAEVTGPNTFSLSPRLNDPADISPGDRFSVDYRLRVGSSYVPKRQPVIAVESVRGEVSGVVPPENLALSKAKDPLLDGRSTRAGDQVLLLPGPEGSDPVPSVSLLPVRGERHVVLEGPEYLARVGADPVTVVVRDASGIPFLGPLDPRREDQDPDWELILPTDRQYEPLGIRFRSGGPIRPGDTVFVDYDHDENFQVRYRAEGLVEAVQRPVDAMRHADADPLVKIALPVPVDLSMTVVLRRDPARPIQVARVDAALRQALDRLFGGSKLQQGVWQSDIVGAIEAVPGIQHVVLPLRAMGRADGSQVLGEVGSVGPADLEEVLAWQRGSVRCYLARVPLRWPTSPGGGPATLFRGVRLAGRALTLLDDPPGIDGLPLAASPYQVHIIGNAGMLLPGLTDDSTLSSLLPADANRDTVVALRRQATRNRLLISLPAQDPQLGATEVSYVVSGRPSTASDVACGPFEHLVLGSVQVEYDQAAS